MRPSKHSYSARNSAPDFFSPQVSGARRFYLNLKPSKAAPLAIVSGGLEHCLPNYRVQRRTFPFYSIEYVIRGAGSLKLNHRRHALTAGTVFSYGPGISHDIAADASAPLVKYFVDFSGVNSEEVLQTCHLAPGSVTRLALPHELQNLFDELIDCGQRSGPGTSDLCAKLLECLALRIAVARIPHETAETHSLQTYQHCRRHMEENFLRLKTLAQISEECHLDGAYLCRLFQRYDHQSPYRFLMRLKMNCAAEWLSEPGAMVKQVAERAGFRDQFHFSRAFKNVFGISPDTFRRLR